MVMVRFCQAKHNVPQFSMMSFYFSDHQRAFRAKDSREHRIQWVQGRRCARQGIPAGAKAILFHVPAIHWHFPIAFRRRRRGSAKNRTIQNNFGTIFLEGTAFKEPFKWHNLSPSTIHKKNIISQHLEKMKLRNCDILDVVRSVQYMPLNKLQFLRIHNFVQNIESTFPSIKHCIVLFNEQLVW